MIKPESTGKDKFVVEYVITKPVAQREILKEGGRISVNNKSHQTSRHTSVTKQQDKAFTRLVIIVENAH